MFATLSVALEKLLLVLTFSLRVMSCLQVQDELRVERLLKQLLMTFPF